MKIKPTMIAVIIFIIVLLFAASSAMAGQFRVALGYTVANSTLPYGEVGYELDNGVEFTAAEMAAGSTARGDQHEVQTVSVSKVVRPDWKFLGATNYYRIGVSYVNGSPLVGDTNFRLGIGLEWRIVQLEYFHFSSAGIHQPNTGIDGVQLRFPF